MKKPKPKHRPAGKNTRAQAQGHGLRRPLLWSLGIGILMAGVWLLVFPRHPAPPVVPLGAIDPALRHLIETSRVAVARAPKSATAWGKLGQALHAAEFKPEAQMCYSNAVRREPQNFRWHYLLGVTELQGNQELALQHLTRATELVGDKSDSPRFQLARAFVEQGQFEKAAPHLERLITANPNHAAARVELARVHLARGALREATRMLQPAMTNQLTMRAGLLLSAQIAQRNGQAELATQISSRAAPLPRAADWPDTVLREVQSLRTDRVHLADQAHGYIQQQRLPEAETALQKLLSSFPGDPEGLLLLGRLRFLERRCAEAESAYRQHLRAQPNSLNGLIQLGLALMCQEQWTNAAAVLEQAVAIKPDFGQAHHNLGAVRSKMGDAAGAIRAFRDALRANPGEINAHLSLASELANVGQLEEAKEHVQSAAALNPKDPRVLKAREQLEIK
jgi:tetratricopeptide (TPR) repeat protein